MTIQFDSRKSMVFYIEVLETLSKKQKDLFRQKVRDLYDRKVVSDDGEFGEFVITKDDIVGVAKTFVKKA